MSETRRTFEEICKELAGKLPEGWYFWGVSEGGFADFSKEVDYITIWPDGDVGIDASLHQTTLAAIAAACAEISANYDAEQHGKETQDHEG